MSVKEVVCREKEMKKKFGAHLPLPRLRAGAAVEKKPSCLQNSQGSSCQPVVPVRTSLRSQ